MNISPETIGMIALLVCILVVIPLCLIYLFLALAKKLTLADNEMDKAEREMDEDQK